MELLILANLKFYSPEGLFLDSLTGIHPSMEKGVLGFNDTIPGMYRHHSLLAPTELFFFFFFLCCKGFTIRRFFKNGQWSASRNSASYTAAFAFIGKLWLEVSSQNHIQAIQFKSPGGFSWELWDKYLHKVSNPVSFAQVCACWTSLLWGGSREAPALFHDTGDA